MEWRVQPVFVSSTFRDMQSERDHLQQVVFPALEERLWNDASRGAGGSARRIVERRERSRRRVADTDGLSERGAALPSVRDRPAGAPLRVGAARCARSTPPPRRRCGRRRLSVTALEIECALRAVEPESRDRCLVYLREPLPWTEMPRETAADYCEEFAADEEAGYRRASLAALREELAGDPRIAPRLWRYRASWDRERQRVTALDEFGRMVLEDLSRELSEVGEEAPEGIAAEVFLELHTRHFLGREAFLEEAVRHGYGPDSGGPWGWLIAGEPGAGATSVFAMLHRKIAPGYTPAGRESGDVGGAGCRPSVVAATRGILGAPAAEASVDRTGAGTRSSST